jgi:adenosine kinase
MNLRLPGNPVRAVKLRVTEKNGVLMANPRILICGSVAFDTICVFPGRFGEHILPDKTHNINVSFMVDNLKREWGGCAANIAYSLKMLGGHPIVMATVGVDAQPYVDRFAQLGIDTSGLKVLTDAYTAQCHITTDLADNQITAFHAGAMFRSNENDAASIPNLALGIVSPDGRDGMLKHCAQLSKAGVPFIFDPGQAMPALSADDIRAMIAQASYLTVNDYEASLIEDKTGQKIEHFAATLKGVVVTLGGEGSRVYEGGKVVTVPVVPAAQVVDPTGCGDSYRAGLLYGLSRGWTLSQSAQLAGIIGSIKIAARGPQNHSFTLAQLSQAYAKHYGQPMPA